jgi:Cu/Ag efflux pump CusA
MASAVIFGLALATILTLVVVPTLYALIYTTSRKAGHWVKRIHHAYWAPLNRIIASSEKKKEV